MENESCIFCQIVAGKAPANIVYQDDKVTAFYDIHPAAPTHILIVTNKHISSLNEITDATAGALLLVTALLAKKMGIDHDGYRTVINTGKFGGQVVYHLHVHLLGGKRMQLPMG